MTGASWAGMRTGRESRGFVTELEPKASKSLFPKARRLTRTVGTATWAAGLGPELPHPESCRLGIGSCGWHQSCWLVHDPSGGESHRSPGEWIGTRLVLALVPKIQEIPLRSGENLLVLTVVDVARGLQNSMAWGISAGAP